MKNKKTVLWFALIVMAIIPACTQQYDTRLNGTWALDEENPIIRERGGSPMRLTLENGNIEYKEDYDEDSLFGKGTHIQKGTYIIKDDNILQTITHIQDWGTKFKSLVELKEPQQKTIKYSVDGKKLTLYGGNYNFGNIFRGIDPLELIRDKETLKISSIKKSEPVKKSSGSASSFPGRWQLIEGRGDAKDVELFKDGTGTADGKGITWKIENGRFHILHPLYTFSAYYNVTGSTVTFTKEDGAITKYQKK